MEAVIMPIERSQISPRDPERPNGPGIRPAAGAGFLAALAIHGVILFWRAPFFEPAAFGVRSGEASAEALFSGSEGAVEFEFLPPIFEDSEAVKEERGADSEKPAVILQSESAPADNAPGPASAVLSGEGVPWTDPDYAVNRPPAYPPDALRRNLEGTVILAVRINESGAAESVEVETSSGYAALDRVARSAVGGWVFRPARIGGIAVPSKSRVPVEFKILRDE